MKSNDEQRLSVGEVAAELEVSEKTVRRFISRGELPAYKIHARRLFVLRRDLDMFIESRRTAPAPLHKP